MSESWRFTPSLLEPNASWLSSFVHHTQAYCTPTPGGTNTLYQPQAGDLHTPSAIFGIGTPLSNPTSDGLFNTAACGPINIPEFHQAALEPYQFHHPSVFQTEPTYSPHQFTVQPSNVDNLGSYADTSFNDALDLGSQENSPVMTYNGLNHHHDAVGFSSTSHHREQ